MHVHASREAREMSKAVLKSVVVGLVLAMVASTGMASAVTRAADKLVADQMVDGSWPAEPNFAGESTIGLCHAFKLTNNNAYKTAAEGGGAYSLNYAGYNPSTGGFSFSLIPAEAYAMARLSAIQANPGSNSWRTALVDDLDAVNATAATILWYQNNAEDSSAVYDVARMAVAADYAGHASTTVWRDGVITLLSDIENSDASPVMALGAAVWALASTGDISTDTRVVWTGVQVKDLPGMLAGWQAPDDSFHTKFDNTMGEGFTETTVLGTLGLQAADASSPSYSFSSEIAAAVGVLESGVGDPGGEVYWAINNPLSGAHSFVGGETLEAIPEPATMTVLLIGAVGVIRRRRGNEV